MSNDSQPPDPSEGSSLGRCLVTGATGLLGSHLVERLLARAASVRALVRRESDTAFLESLGVEIFRGDLNDRECCDQALVGIETVFHAASKVGDWGTWEQFQRDSISATQVMGEAAASRGLRRFVHISSTSAYGHPREGQPPVTEAAELGQNLWPIWDHYTRSKVDQERVLWRLAEQGNLPLTVIRPSWLYGERDRTTTARFVRKLRAGGIPLIGKGDNPLSAVYAGEVASCAVLAAEKTVAAGQAYNLTDLGPINQREFFELWARACGVEPSRQSWPYSAVFGFALALEAGARAVGSSRPPLITRYATWLMGRNLGYSTAKARGELGWAPAETYEQTIGRTVAWYLERESARGAGRG